MSEHSEASHLPNPINRFSDANLQRVLEGTMMDLEVSESAVELAESIAAHYKADQSPASTAELLRLWRFAELASFGTPEGKRKIGATAIYVGELLALDQGCRITGNLVYPSTELQQTILKNLKDVPDHLKEVGKLDSNLEPVRMPKNAAYLQEQRNEQWGQQVYQQASKPVRAEDIDLTPIQETIIRFTSELDPDTAEAMKVGFWLVMRHLIEPGVIPSITLRAEAAAQARERDQADDTISADLLSEMHPELQNGQTNEALYFARMDDAIAFISYKFLGFKAVYPETEDRDEIKEQQRTLEVKVAELLKSSADLPKGSAIQVDGEFLYYTLDEEGKMCSWLMPEADSSYLRGDFAGITVKRAYIQKALTEYANSDYETLPDYYDRLTPHIKLENAMFINLDHNEHTIESVFNHPVEIPLFYKDVRFSKLTVNDSDES